MRQRWIGSKYLVVSGVSGKPNTVQQVERKMRVFTEGGSGWALPRIKFETHFRERFGS